MILQLCLFTLISLSTSTSLDLYAWLPTDPLDASDSYCCLPRRDVTFTILGRVYVDDETGFADVVYVQADEWVGLACTHYGITKYSDIMAFSLNVSSAYAGNTVRNLVIVMDDFGWVTTVYESNLNPLGIFYYVRQCWIRY